MAEVRDDASVGQLRSLLKRLVDPSEDWAHRSDERKPSAVMIYLAVLLGILLLVAILSARIAEQSEAPAALLTAVWIALGIGAAIIALLGYQIRRYFLDPLAQLYNWALGMCDGDLSSRIPPQQEGRFAKLTFHINRLSEALEKLANEMDDVVWQQTKRLHQRNKSLEVLFGVASAINTTSNLTELLEKSAEMIKPIVKGTGYVVRLRDANGEVSVLGVGAAVDGSAEVPINAPIFEGAAVRGANGRALRGAAPAARHAAGHRRSARPARAGTRPRADEGARDDPRRHGEGAGRSAG